MDKEPALVVGLLVAVVNAVVVLAKLDAATAAPLVAVASALGALLTRSQVTPKP